MIDLTSARLAKEDNLREVTIEVRGWPGTLTPPRKATMLAFITACIITLHFQSWAGHTLPPGEWQDGPELWRGSRWPPRPGHGSRPSEESGHKAWRRKSLMKNSSRAWGESSQWMGLLWWPALGGQRAKRDTLPQKEAKCICNTTVSFKPHKSFVSL